MGKKVWALCSLFLLFSGIASASPLTDYSLGKTAIDVGYGSQGVKERYDTVSNSFDGNGNKSIGITTGLGDRFAIQFKATGISSDDYEKNGIIHVAPKIRTNEVNVLYKVNNNCSAFVGNLYENVEYKSGFARLVYAENSLQAGLVATKALGSKTTGYGLVAFGKDIQNYQLGVGFHVSKQVDFNVEYHMVTYRNTEIYNGSRFSIANHGLNAGFTYTF